MKNENKKRKIVEDKRIPSWRLKKFIVEHENNKEYREDCFDSNDDPDSEWDKGYDACIDELKQFLEEFE